MNLTKETAVNDKSVCLHCGQQNDSLTYSCDCKTEDWVQQYRVLDIDIDPESIHRPVSESFQTYSFDHAAGMLQYQGLPFHQHFMPKSIKSVGLTPLHELSYLSDQYGCRVFLKNEGDNPSGCFKDRESMMCLLHSIHTGLNKAVIYSSGNAAASAASFVEDTDHHLITFVAGDTYLEKIDYIRSHGSDVIIIGDRKTNFEKGYRLFSQMNAARVFEESGFDNWSVRNPYRVQGDKTIAVEIAKQLSLHGDEVLTADFVLVPTANGSCLAGIWKGFKELKQAGAISKLPKMVSVGIRNANPVHKAVQQRETNHPVQCDPSKVDDEDAKIGSIILTEEGYDSIEAAKAVIESKGIAVGLHTSDLQNALVDFLNLENSLAVKNGILPEPAALTSLAAIKKIKAKTSVSPSDICVSILTGHGLKARKIINSLLSGRPGLQAKAREIAARQEKKMQYHTQGKGKKVRVEANISAVVQSFCQLQKLSA